MSRGLVSSDCGITSAGVCNHYYLSLKGSLITKVYFRICGWGDRCSVRIQRQFSEISGINYM